MKALLLLVCGFATAFSATPEHVHWMLQFDGRPVAPGAKVVGKLTATVDTGWHLYSLTTPPGPIATTLTVTPNAAIDSVHLYQPKPERKYDPNFQADTETYEGSAEFLIELAVKREATPGAISVEVKPRYQVCSSTSCIPPVTRTAIAEFPVQAGAAAVAFTLPAGYTDVTSVKAAAAPGAGNAAPAEGGLGAFLLTAFGFGLASIFTPCVFPMIPITMSFFLNQSERSRRASVAQAAIFCLGIIVLFSALGLITSALLGASGVKQLGSNAWVNGVIATVFLAFGLSLLGAFEITLPSAVLTRMNRASEGGGTAGTLIMGLTFALTSFACVGPFMGSLLAASVQGGAIRPLLGMAVFATGLAMPFFLLAIFPSYLKKLPRSGGWLARVKVVMGFVIIAAMLKYLSAIDLVLRWNLLTRERFLAAWIVLFLMAGLYLLGFLRLEGIGRDEKLGLGRLFTGMAFVVFSITLIPGMSGARLGELDAIVPPPDKAAGDASGLVWLTNDLEGALAKAKAEHKKVLVNFTGYACTNCHWMKSNMFPKPEIMAALKDFVLVDLYTDSTDAASQANQKLEETKFNTIAIPFYAIYDPARTGADPVVATFPGLTRNEGEFAAFLRTAGPVTPAAATVSGSPLDGAGLSALPGQTFDATASNGKVLVVNFWATWCVPCRQEIPAFNALYAKYGQRGVAVVGVSLDDDAGVIAPFLKVNPIAYPVAVASDATKTRFGVEQLPVTLLFDRNGKQLQRFDGFTKPDAIDAAVLAAL